MKKVVVKLKKGKDIYGEVGDYNWNWKGKFLVITMETGHGETYKNIVHWDNIEYVMEIEVK